MLKVPTHTFSLASLSIYIGSMETIQIGGKLAPMIIRNHSRPPRVAFKRLTVALAWNRRSVKIFMSIRVLISMSNFYDSQTKRSREKITHVEKFSARCVSWNNGRIWSMYGGPTARGYRVWWAVQVMFFLEQGIVGDFSEAFFVFSFATKTEQNWACLVRVLTLDLFVSSSPNTGSCSRHTISIVWFKFQQAPTVDFWWSPNTILLGWILLIGLFVP